MNQPNLQLNPERLKKSLQSDTYVDLVMFLSLHLESLNNIDEVADIEDPIAQAVEVKAQKKAHKKLKSILSKIITMGTDTSKPVSTRDNDYGVDVKETDEGTAT